MKPVQTNRFGLVFQNKNQFKPVWLGFFILARFFLVWLVFFGFGSVRFFWFQTYKTGTEPISFFKILIGFFHGLVFSVFLFYFLDLIGFSVFFNSVTNTRKGSIYWATGLNYFYKRTGSIIFIIRIFFFNIDIVKFDSYLIELTKLLKTQLI